MYRKLTWKVFCNSTTGKKLKVASFTKFYQFYFQISFEEKFHFSIPLFYGRSLKVPLSTEIFVNVYFSIKYPLKSPLSTEDHFRVAFKWTNFRKDHKIHFKTWNFLCIVLCNILGSVLSVFSLSLNPWGTSFHRNSFKRLPIHKISFEISLSIEDFLKGSNLFEMSF